MVFYHRIESTLNRRVSLVNFTLLSSILHSLLRKNLLKIQLLRHMRFPCWTHLEGSALRFSQSVCPEFLSQPPYNAEREYNLATESFDCYLILFMILGPNSNFNADLDMRSLPVYPLEFFSQSAHLYSSVSLHNFRMKFRK